MPAKSATAVRRSRRTRARHAIASGSVSENHSSQHIDHTGEFTRDSGVPRSVRASSETLKTTSNCMRTSWVTRCAPPAKSIAVAERPVDPMRHAT